MDIRSGVPGFVLRLVISGAALGVAATLVPGIMVNGASSLIMAALLFGLVNAVVKPVLELVTCPLIMLTMGLFTFVINALLMMITDWLAGQFDVGFEVDGFVPALLGAIIVSIVSWVLTEITD